MNDQDLKAFKIWINSTPENKFRFENHSLLLELTASEAWQAALAYRDAQASAVNQQLLWAAKNVINNDVADGSTCYDAVKLYEARNELKAAIASAEATRIDQ